MSPLSSTDKALRSSGIFASEIAAVCGLHPYKVPIDVFCEKLGIELGERDDHEEQADLGHYFEPVVARVYADKHPYTILEPCRSTIHPEHKWIGATPDRMVVGGDVDGLEIKLVGANMVHHWSDESPPDYVIAQVQWQMFVMGWKSMCVVGLLGGTDYREYVIGRDDEQISLMFTIAREFWNDHVLVGVPPKVDGSNSYKEFLSRRFPRNTSPMVRLKGDEENEAVQLADEYSKASEALKLYTKSKAYSANALRELVGDAAGVFAGNWKITWKANKNGDRTILVKVNKQKAEGRKAAA